MSSRLEAYFLVSSSTALRSHAFLRSDDLLTHITFHLQTI